MAFITLKPGSFTEGRFIHGVTVLASGTTAAQAVVILASPILTRLYTPEQFGVLAVYAAALSIVIVIASLRYQLAIPLPRTDGSAANVLAVALACVAVVTLVSAVIVGLYKQDIAVLANASELASLLWLLPVGVLLGGVYEALSYWAVRKKSFGLIARTNLQQGFGMAATQVVLGVAQLGPIGLIIGQIVGTAAGLSSLAASALSQDRHVLKRIRLRRAMQQARRFRRFPQYLTWSGLANSAGAQLPMLLFAALFSPATAGLYFLADRVTRAPASLVGNAVSRVFLSDAAEARREGRLDRLALRVIRGLVRVSVGPFMLMAIVAPELFSVAFGPEWLESGHFVQWMTPMLIASFVVAPLTTLHVVLERQRRGLLFQVTLLISRMIAIGVGVKLGGEVLTIAIFSFMSCAVYAYFGCWILNTSGVPYSDILRTICLEILILSPVAFGMWVMKAIVLGSNISNASLTDDVVFILATVLAVIVVLAWRARPFLKDI